MNKQRFIDEVVQRARERGDSAAMTYVIIAAARAAADMAPVHADGTIDEDAARDVLSRASARLARTP